MTRSGKTCRVVCNAVSRFSDSRPAVGRLSPGSRSSACTSASCGQPSDRPRPSVSASLRRCGPQASGRRDVRNRSAQPLSAGFAPARKPFENRQARFLPDFQARIAPKITVLYTNGKICAKEHKSHFAFYALLLSHPTRGAWIEMLSPDILKLLVQKSHPTRGAWIEICNIYLDNMNCVSHPTRGAWIEILINHHNKIFVQSHPTRGAWIEILASAATQIITVGRTLPGVRGLKYGSHYRRRS